MATAQITVRIDDTLVGFIDHEVTAGHVASRAAMVARALERERRRLIAERDIERYAAQPDDDLDGLTAWAAHIPLDNA